MFSISVHIHFYLTLTKGTMALISLPRPSGLDKVHSQRERTQKDEGLCPASTPSGLKQAGISKEIVGWLDPVSQPRARMRCSGKGVSREACVL